MKYVIIGNSAAAVGCIEGIRSADKKGEITVISNEAHHVYGRPLISYLLEGKTDLERMKYRPDDFYKKNQCSTILSATVTNLDSKNRLLLLDNGKTVSYDKLMVATGSSPFIPPFKGLDSVNEKFTFMSLDDALSLEKRLTKDKKVLIVGAGLIGLKCAEGIYGRCKSITVVDLSDRILSSILDAPGAAIVQDHLEQKGIEFHLSAGVDCFDTNTALLSNGEKIHFDLLVLAVGVRPNTALVKDAGGEVARGIVTSDKMETGIEDVYAAGDCCESYDITAEQRRILAIMPNAYAQGYTAGRNMAGQSETFENAFPMNAIGFFGLHIITAGNYTGEVFERQEGQNYKKLFYEDGLLKGFILIGNVAKAGIYTSLVRERTPLDSIDFELVCEEPTLMAFSRKYRDLKLGGISV